MTDYISRELAKEAAGNAYINDLNPDPFIDDVPAADVVERLLVEDKINWLRSRCRAGVEQYFDREQWDHLMIINVRDSIAKRKTGKWIDANFNYLFKCSECNYYDDIRTTYCPGCGARMVSDDV